MAPGRPFELVYDPEMAEHLAAIERRYFGLIEKNIFAQLRYEP